MFYFNKSYLNLKFIKIQPIKEVVMTPWKELLFRIDWNLIKEKKWDEFLKGIEWDLERGIFNPWIFLIDILFFTIIGSVLSLVTFLIFR